jgi:peptidoglycan/xylan/chitin deacetylase (PgdA/CDA1 family)
VANARRPRQRHGYASSTLVLCYHAVSDTWEVPWAVTTRQLREQLELLVARGYRGVTFHEAVTANPPGPALAITFDDGFASVLERAFPTLSSLGLVGTVFAVTDFAENGELLDWPGIDGWRETHESELRGLTWAELDQLAAGGWEVGSHTRTHPRLTQLDDDAVADELAGSRAACERALSRPCRSLAYPFGDVDERVIIGARTAGYEAAASLPVGVVSATQFLWPRVGIYRKDLLGRFRLKVSPRVSRVREALGSVERVVRT